MAILQIKDSNGNWQEIAALKGDTGPRGETPEIDLKATTLPAGSAATVTKSGTVEHPVFTLGIPKGETPTDVVKTVNNQAPDASGNVNVTVSGGGSNVDVSSLIPKTGDRGVLAGFNTCVQISASESVTEVTIDENSPDDLVISVIDAPLTITFASNNNVAYVKNILLYCENPLAITVNFGETAFVDTFYSNGFVNELALSMMNQIVVTGYSMLDSNGSTPYVLVSNKVLM